MALGSFEKPTTPNEDNEEKKTPENQAEADVEHGNNDEKNPRYKANEGVGQRVSSLRDELDPEIVKKLEGRKKKEQEDEDDNEPLDKAA